ncbi:MAG: ATP synthase subunit I [candidate division NC10 bacterium]|nr:ATP synthase subunit I [candidate division NC10 bacterium]
MDREIVRWLLGKGIDLGEDEGLIPRSIRVGMALSLLLLVPSALLGRGDWFLGLLLGSALSLLHFRLLIHSICRWLQPDGKGKPPPLWRGFLFRLLFTGGAMAVALLYLPMNLLALAIGLFAAQAGLLLSFLLQRGKGKEE